MQVNNVKAYRKNKPNYVGYELGRMNSYHYNRCKVDNLTEPEEDSYFNVEVGALDLFHINKDVRPELNPPKLIVSCYNPVKCEEEEHSCINCCTSITEHTIKLTNVREVDGEFICENCWSNDSTVVDMFPINEPVNIIKSLENLEAV